MTTTKSQFEKTYVGKGKMANEKLQILKITLDMETAESFVHEYEGKKYLTVEIAQMKEADKYGRTHTAWVSEKLDSKAKPKKRK